MLRKTDHKSSINLFIETLNLTKFLGRKKRWTPNQRKCQECHFIAASEAIVWSIGISGERWLVVQLLFFSSYAYVLLVVHRFYIFQIDVAHWIITGDLCKVLGTYVFPWKLYPFHWTFLCWFTFFFSWLTTNPLTFSTTDAVIRALCKRQSCSIEHRPYHEHRQQFYILFKWI